MARILVGVSGGIAAYKALEFVRLATAAGHAVRVVQTPTSKRFVGEASFAAITGAPVLTDEFEPDPARGAFPGEAPPSHQPLSHLRPVENADLYLIAPASANTLAKLAAGMADNLLCACALAAPCPVAVAPAMNNRMYEHPATQASLAKLRERGVHTIDPDSGRLASMGEEGIGRLAEPQRLLAECEGLLANARADGQAKQGLAGEQPAAGVPGPGLAEAKSQDASETAMAGLRVLATAGGTREPIDSVRFLGNRSSGKMGLALAAAAQRRGARVTLVAANVSLPVPEGIEVIAVRTAAELQDACEARFAGCDVLLMAAAVADFRPVQASTGKIKKAGRDALRLELEPTADVLSGLAARRIPGQTLVGFAAEHGAEAVLLGRDKLAAKGVDALVVNDISREDIGFEADTNEVTILTAGGEQHVARADKRQVAEAVLDTVLALRDRA